MSETTQPYWSYHKVSHPTGISFEIAVNRCDSDPIRDAYRAGDYPASSETLMALSMLEPGMVAVDLGAHIGTFTLGAASLGCRVIAVEASTLNYNSLIRSMSLNRFHQVTVVKAAVSDQPGTVRFLDHGPYGHMDAAEDDEKTISVRARTASEILDACGVERVDLIKIDVEGAEIRAMNGMQPLLCSDSAPPVLLESNGHTLGFGGHSTRELRAAFEDFGYRLYLPQASKLIPVKSGDLQPELVVDYLAIKGTPVVAGWPVVAPRNVRRLLEVAQQAAQGDELTRSHLARELKQSTLPDDPAFAALRRELSNDDSEIVRKAAA